MKLNLIVSTETQDRCALSEQELLHIAEYVLEREHIRCTTELSVQLVGISRMQELNCDWRGIDAPTDVLSLECERPGDESTGIPTLLGDIILCPSYIARQAAQYEASEQRETALLLIHGLLHLLGYDHETDDEARLMETLEERYLAEIAS